LERLSGSSVGINRVQVVARKSSRVVRRVERVGCGGQALKVLAMVHVCLDSVNVGLARSIYFGQHTKGRPQ
jgi:hypothetical protein